MLHKRKAAIIVMQCIRGIFRKRQPYTDLTELTEDTLRESVAFADCTDFEQPPGYGDVDPIASVTWRNASGKLVSTLDCLVTVQSLRACMQSLYEDPVNIQHISWIDEENEMRVMVMSKNVTLEDFVLQFRQHFSRSTITRTRYDVVIWCTES